MIALALAAAISAIPAADVETDCARAAHGNPIATASCVSDEQFNYDAIKGIWPRVPENVRQNCINVMAPDRHIPEGYTRLARCLVYMLPVINAASARPFRR